MNLVFVESSWLWLLLALPLFWFLPRRASHWKHATIRSAVAFLLILALARPGVLTELDDTYQVLIWDRSESVDPSTSAAVSDWAESLPRSSRARIVTLGIQREDLPELRDLKSTHLDGSSIGQALSVGARMIPQGAVGAITVVSDGMSTDPHWGDAVHQLVERKIPVHAITVSRSDNEVYPSAIHTRPPIRVGQTTKVNVEVVGKVERAVVSLMEGDEVLARSEPFSSEKRTAVELEFEPSRAGLLDVVATVEVLEGTDSNPDNNRFPSTLAIQEPIRALYLSERLTDSRDKMTALLGSGVELSDLSQAGLDQLANDPESIAAYDLVLIDDRPAESIPLALQEAIVTAVQKDGVGLFYAGGKAVFGTGGYFDTPVASILPLEMIQKEEKRDPSTTLVVVIDTSGSMGGERVQLAKECARLAIRRLLPHDKVGIVEFYGTKQWAAPIQSAANAIEIQRAINRMDAGGGTVILPAIEEAFYAMQNVQTRYKHVLVLTDGGVERGNFESLMRQMSGKGINVSTVLVGSDAHSEFLVNIANWGKGHFYSASSRFNIPEILLKQPSTSKIPPYRPGEHLVSMGGPSGWWGDISRPENPQISGYVETRLRPGAQVAIETEVERHPVLASWRSGLGRVSALTTEPVGEGTAPWREWDSYGAWLMRVLARTSREHPQPFSYTIERSRSGARIVAQGLTTSIQRPLVERIHSDGISESLVFQQRAPKVFTAGILADPEETIHLRGGAEGWPGSMAHLVSPAWKATAPEHNVDPTNAIDLNLLASTTGGISVSLQNSAALNPSTGGVGRTSDLLRLWPWCLLLALLAYLGDILYRRSPGFARAGAGKVAALLLVSLLGIGSIPEASAEISPALEAQLQQTLEQDPFQVDDQSLYRAALVEDEALEPLLSRLDELRQADEEPFATVWLSASLQWRYGNFDQALELFRKAAELRGEALTFFRVAQILDTRGQTTEAVKLYQKSLQAKPDAELARRIQLRLALLKSTSDVVDEVVEDLPAFARKQDQVFQNRAGVALALTGKPKEALNLYKAAEEGKHVFKQLIRIAEWSMAADDMAKAQESAWNALHAAKLKRDRRYALTILTEAYRSDQKIDQLIARFAAAPDLSEDARMAWIDLLREQGDVDKALALFQRAKADADNEEGFTAGMRRKLLDICREAGREDLLVKNFEEMIAKEPRRLEWRSGLSRFHLERGERKKGEAVWSNYKEQARRSDWLAAAEATSKLGLDELAGSFAEQLIKDGKGNEPLAALQFLFDTHKARGREDDMKSVLIRMDKLAAPDASERARIAESWEQLGRQDKAVEVLEKLRVARGPDNFSSDLDTRLAWLYSETGQEEKAFEAWKSVWLRIDSPGRRRYIEDRLMATASRLGKLADIAIELEEKLAAGTADKRDSSLLVRLYTKVGDPVSASEIIHDFMKLTGGAEIKMLEEQARVYVMCNDYYHYEKTLRKLIKLDPAGTPEYLTQLAMSSLERGRNDEAQAILVEMRSLESNPASAEFEAGVLKIAGMHEEAAAAYWRGIAENPERIDGYLLLGRSLQKLGKAEQAVGMFQYLVENAEKDDLFTIAVDGLLNMNNPRQGSRLTPETLRWIRRAILERLAGKDDKLYLFRLLSDISEDLNDQPMMVRALAETLPVAGEQRTAQLRELMEIARVGTKNQNDVMRFGRRLIGMGEIIPPQVYLDLGTIFLDSGDIRNAAKTFNNANGGLDQNGYQRKVAATFEGKRFIKSALRNYEQLLVTSPDDVEVLVKVGELKEQLGRGSEAVLAYRRALDILMETQPLFSFKEDKSSGSRNYYFSRNTDRFGKYYKRTLFGFLATSGSDGEATASLLEDSITALEADLKRVEKEGAENSKTLTLANVPRVSRRSELIRRLALGDGYLAQARSADTFLLKAFPEDSTLLTDTIRTWESWGYHQPARALINVVPNHPGKTDATRMLTDGSSGPSREILRLILRGDDTQARKRLREMELSLNSQWSSDEYNALLVIARCLEEPQTIERLVRLAINKAPRRARLRTCQSLLTRAAPFLTGEQLDRLISYVQQSLFEGGAQSPGGLSAYSYRSLKQLTGDKLTIPAEVIQPEVEKLLAQGGYYTRSIAFMFAFLSPEDYEMLLRETYRKAKAADRLGILFSLLRQYPGKMDEAIQKLFSELLDEATKDTLEDPLKIYRMSNRGSSGGFLNHPNSDFEARMLGKFADRAKGEQKLGFLVEEVLASRRAGNQQRGFEAADKLLGLALNDEKAFAAITQLQTQLPPVYLDEFLSIIDEVESESWPMVALEKKRLLLVRQAPDSDRQLPILRKAIEKFPKETFFREELRKELEKEGRYAEAIVILEDLIRLEPDNVQHRNNLSRIWTKLSHPIKARAFGQTKPKIQQAKPKPAPPRSGIVRSATVTKKEKLDPAVTKDQEQPLPKPSTQLIKKHYEAGKPADAGLVFRRLWRQFSSMNQRASSGRFQSYRSANSRYYEWPQDTSSKPQAPTAPLNPRLDGLKAFLEVEPTPLPQPTRQATPIKPTIFQAIGSEEFMAEEIAVWLRLFEPNEYSGTHFEELLRGIVAYRIAQVGIEPYLSAAFAQHQKGELPTLDQHALIIALELHPDAGGEAATAFLRKSVDDLTATDMWQAARLARCFVKRGDEDSALSIYRWCGASTSLRRYNYHRNFTAQLLIQEIRENLSEASRIRALEVVLRLITHEGSGSSAQAELSRFVISTWAEELAPHEIYRRCPDECKEIIREYVSTLSPNTPAVDKATLFLAAGGNTDEALKGLPLILKPPRGPKLPLAGSRNYDYLLQQWLPEDMGAWTGADRWLSGIARQVLQWEADKQLSTPESVRILSYVAVRQYQNDFRDSARKTLALIEGLSHTDAHAAIWLIDAADISGNHELAIRAASELLKQQRLPILRIAQLMEAVAEKDGLPASLVLAEAALEYTRERGFLETMTKLCKDAGDEKKARIWDEYFQQAWGTDAIASTATRKAADVYRKSIEGNQAGRTDGEDVDTFE